MGQSRAKYNQFFRSKAVVCVSTPRMYPRSGYFLVHLIFEICFKDVERLTAVDAVDTVDNMEILFLKYASKMFKDLLLLTPLTLLTSKNLEKTYFFLQSFAVDTVDITYILFLKYASKIFKDLLPLTLLTSQNSEITHFFTNLLLLMPLTLLTSKNLEKTYFFSSPLLLTLLTLLTSHTSCF